MMLPIEAHTSICLDLSGPAAAAIQALRRRCGYGQNGVNPPEITVAGSSGVGPLAVGQDAAEVFAALDAVAARTPPVTVDFAGLVRFPDTDIVVAVPADPGPLTALHEQLVASGISFDPDEHPWTPHCTITQSLHDLAGDVDDLLAEPVPGVAEGGLLSTYVAARLPLILRHRAVLAG